MFWKGIKIKAQIYANYNFNEKLCKLCGTLFYKDFLNLLYKRKMVLNIALYEIH